MYVVRSGKVRGQGHYLTSRARTSMGQVLLGGGSQKIWVKKQSEATRFETVEAAENFSLAVYGTRRVVSISGKKITRLERAEQAGWSSALHEVSSSLGNLHQADDPSDDAEGRAVSQGYRYALSCVQRIIDKLRTQR